MAQPQRLANEGAKKISQLAEENWGSMEQISEQIQSSAAEIQKRAKEYTDVAIKYARKNPMYVTVGVLAVGFLAGLMLTRSSKKQSE